MVADIPCWNEVYQHASSEEESKEQGRHAVSCGVCSLSGLGWIRR